MHAIARAPSVGGRLEPREGVMLRALASNVDSFKDPEPGGILFIGTNTKDYGSSQKQHVHGLITVREFCDFSEGNRLSAMRSGRSGGQGRSRGRGVQGTRPGQQASRRDFTKLASAMVGLVEVGDKGFSIPPGK